MGNLLLLAPETIKWICIASGVGVFLILAGIFLAMVPTKIWFRCAVSGTYVSMFKLLGMKLRGMNISSIIDNYINGRKAGLNITVSDLEAHVLAGGDIEKVVDALIAAHSAKIGLTIQEAKAIDLAGRDVRKAVQDSVIPKVIETPRVSAIAKDGIELMVKAKVTVKTNLNKLIGGAGEETIISRVGEGIVTTVGSAKTHKEVLQNPDIISRVVIDKGLDDGTIFQILSIDIADIDVGRNIGAELEQRQAIADKEIAQAQAEERKAMAIAAEQEMKAKAQEMKAHVIAAEVEVPKAMASAFRNGKMGIMDYYKLQNIQADTSMRKSISKSDDDTTPGK